MNKKVIFLALSINDEILNTHFYESFINYIEDKYQELPKKYYDIKAIVYTQGFNRTHTSGLIEFIRDDTMYNKGYTISEIRDYFTKKAIEDYNPDYIFHCDDDFKFRERSLYSLYRDLEYLENHPEVGMTNMHYHRAGPDKDSEYYDFNPSRVATRMGILFKTDAYVSWGSEHKVTYFEECVLATYAYQKGYEIKHSVSDTIHKTKSTGLGLSLERKYGKCYIPDSGRKVMSELGLFVPSIHRELGYPRYDLPCKLSDKLIQDHKRNKFLKFGISD